MSLEHWELVQRQRGNIIRAGMARVFRGAFGDVPLPPPETRLEREYRDNAKKLAELFAPVLKMSEREYLASLPKFTPQPEAFRGRFDIPVLVETRIPVARQCELAGVLYYLINPVRDWSEDPKGYRTPNGPYTTWMQDGGRNKGISIERVRSELAEDERGATVFDGLALLISHPEVLNDHFIDLVGTEAGSFFPTPSLDRWGSEPRLCCLRAVISLSRFGSATCGRT